MIIYEGWEVKPVIDVVCIGSHRSLRISRRGCFVSMFDFGKCVCFIYQECNLYVHGSRVQKLFFLKDMSWYYKITRNMCKGWRNGHNIWIPWERSANCNNSKSTKANYKVNTHCFSKWWNRIHPSSSYLTSTFPENEHRIP